MEESSSGYQRFLHISAILFFWELNLNSFFSILLIVISKNILLLVNMITIFSF